MILTNAAVMQCLQGWVVKTHPLQVHRITLHSRGYEVMQFGGRVARVRICGAV